MLQRLPCYSSPAVKASCVDHQNCTGENSASCSGTRDIMPSYLCCQLLPGLGQFLLEVGYLMNGNNQAACKAASSSGPHSHTGWPTALPVPPVPAASPSPLLPLPALHRHHSYSSTLVSRPCLAKAKHESTLLVVLSSCSLALGTPGQINSHDLLYYYNFAFLSLFVLFKQREQWSLPASRNTCCICTRIHWQLSSMAMGQTHPRFTVWPSPRYYYCSWGNPSSRLYRMPIARH